MVGLVLGGANPLDTIKKIRQRQLPDKGRPKNDGGPDNGTTPTQTSTGQTPPRNKNDGEGSKTEDGDPAPDKRDSDGDSGDGRPPAVNPTTEQLASAERLGVDPRWVKPDGTIDWPPNNGFDGPPIELTLANGTKIDRYGSNNGGFLSPEGTPFDQRALPNNSVNSKFQTFVVVKPLPVNSGKIAPWFGKPGGGTQYQLKDTNVKKLIEDGYLEVIK